MGFKSYLVISLKIIFGLYIGSALGYIINSIGTTKDYFPAAFYPATIINEIISGNRAVIQYAIIAIIFFLSFNYLRKTFVPWWTNLWH